MKEPFSKQHFNTWKNNLQPNGNLPVFTTDGLIDIDEAQKFITDMKGRGAQSIRVNLVRFDWKDNEPQKIKENGPNHPLGCKWKVFNGNKTQVGIVINGAGKITRSSDYTVQAEDIFEADGNIMLLIPGEKTEGPIGHNPPTPK